MSAVVGILAAGASARMRGRDKLLEPVDGVPLLHRHLDAAAAQGLPVLVALPPGNAARRRLVDEAGARAIEVARAAEGMGVSIAALATEADRQGARALLLILADMPEIGAEDLAAVLAAGAAAPGAVVRAAAADGRAGHPVLFPRSLLPALARLSGDEGARRVIAEAADIRLVRLPGERALTDLDSPEAWAAWRAANPGR